jgi:glycosyltransferase involved in cell wall biosynthesis
MRFSVDAHAIGCHLTGNEVYIRNLIGAFADLDRQAEFIAYMSNREANKSIPARIQRRQISRNPFLRLGYDLPRRLRQDRPDLIHVQYTAPIGCCVPVVVSVHDVSFLEHPEYFTRWRTAQLKWSVERTVRQAVRIVTGSEFSRSAIANAYGLDPDRIAVVPNAASELFRPLPKEAAASWVQARFGFGEPFILSVGDLQPRKNLEGLIRAFAELVRAFPQIPHHLVLAGNQTWYAPKIHKAAEESGVSGRIRFTGFVSDDELLQLYNACEFFVFPSFYEGFGLPVLEAMACGKAVACSNTSALPEVADAAALLFDPYSQTEMTRAMLDLTRDAEYRQRIERLGLHRSALFSWKKTARRTLDVYYEVAGSRGARKRAGVRSASV